MSDYLLGLATIPSALLIMWVTALGMRLAYIRLGKIGRVGIIRFGSTTEEKRLTLGSVVATCGHLLVVLNRGDTGLILFTGRQSDGPSLAEMKQRMRPGIDIFADRRTVPEVGSETSNEGGA